MSAPVPNTQLWLIRHGETEWSLSGAHTSRTDIPLTDNGRQKAELLRDYLAPTPFVAVFTSPMQRAKETCRIAGLIANAQVEEGLREGRQSHAAGLQDRQAFSALLPPCPCPGERLEQKMTVMKNRVAKVIASPVVVDDVAPG